MEGQDIAYYLARARYHRMLARKATCQEARLIHQQLLRQYQTLLLSLRRSRPPVHRPATACF
ncbi:hypothetical protein [Sphingobium aquiterrae]|uniref:hypothetical protein n=1 Tax=Sphingobium aquiterrae TaxID=2038656 RepID=UPI0030161901